MMPITRMRVVLACACASSWALAAPTTRPGPTDAPRAYRQSHPVAAVSDTTVIAEAEEFAPAAGSQWKSYPWGANYYAATFANSFLSRKAFLGAPEQVGAGGSTASITVNVPKAGR